MTNLPIRCAAALAALAAASVARAEIATEPDLQTRHQVIRQALADVQPVRKAVEQYHLHAGRFPTNNAELGMNLPGAYRNYDIKGIAIDPDGAIDITLTATSGVDGGLIRLTPQAAGLVSENKINWTCASPSYTTISDATGGVCEYTNQP